MEHERREDSILVAGSDPQRRSTLLQHTEVAETERNAAADALAKAEAVLAACDKEEKQANEAAGSAREVAEAGDITRAELEALGAFCTARGIRILSDEIWSEIVYAPAQFTSMLALSPAVAANTVVVHGFSKAFALAGLRIGYVAMRSAQAAAEMLAHKRRMLQLRQRAAMLREMAGSESDKPEPTAGP